MSAAGLYLDGDDLSELLVDVERSFTITLPRDLRHVVTIGDLHREIVDRAGPASGAACPTSRVFYTLRRHCAGSDARPDTSLAPDHRSPRALRHLLAQRAGWTMPALVLSRGGCVAMLLSVVAAIVGWAMGHAWIAVPSMIGALIVLVRFDPGRWSGSWATLGTLARAVAATNHATLVKAGARRSPMTVWHALTTMVGETSAQPVAIGRETRLL